MVEEVDNSTAPTDTKESPARCPAPSFFPNVTVPRPEGASAPPAIVSDEGTVLGTRLFSVNEKLPFTNSPMTNEKTANDYSNRSRESSKSSRYITWL
jgi:hypothetical protein